MRKLLDRCACLPDQIRKYSVLESRILTDLLEPSVCPVPSDREPRPITFVDTGDHDQVRKISIQIKVVVVHLDQRVPNGRVRTTGVRRGVRGGSRVGAACGLRARGWGMAGAGGRRGRRGRARRDGRRVVRPHRHCGQHRFLGAPTRLANGGGVRRRRRGGTRRSAGATLVLTPSASSGRVLGAAVTGWCIGGGIGHGCCRPCGSRRQILPQEQRRHQLPVPAQHQSVGVVAMMPLA